MEKKKLRYRSGEGVVNGLCFLRYEWMRLEIYIVLLEIMDKLVEKEVLVRNIGWGFEIFGVGWF